MASDYDFSSYAYVFQPEVQSGGENNVDVAKVVLSLLICIFGLFGNLFAIFVILILKEYQKSVTHWYVLQLAFADSIFLLTLPFKVSEDLNNGFMYPEWMCKAIETILFLNYYASILFLMIVSIDRYIAVCHTFSVGLQKLRKKTTAFIIALATWSISLLLCIPVMLYSFKIGAKPHCRCSYQFPSEVNDTAVCIDEGFNTPALLEQCLKLSRKDSISEDDGEEHCLTIVFTGFGGGNTIDLGSLYGLESSNNTDLLGAIVGHDDAGGSTNQPVPMISASCHYLGKPWGWIAFIAFNFAVMFILPLIVMIVCYGLIVRRLSLTRMTTTNNPSTSSFNQSAAAAGSTKKRKKSSSRSDKDRRRLTIMCAALVACFLICWLPFHANHLAKIVGIKLKDPTFCEILPIVGSLLAYLNSALNSYLYIFLGTNFARRWKMLKESPMMQCCGFNAERNHIGKKGGGNKEKIQDPNENNRTDSEARPSSRVNDETRETQPSSLIATVHNEDQIIESPM